jgi:hypothetical protein
VVQVAVEMDAEDQMAQDYRVQLIPEVEVEVDMVAEVEEPVVQV